MKPPRLPYYEMVQVPLDSLPEYTALSYAWGHPNKTWVLNISGASLAITASLAEALRALPRIASSEYLWLDQVCINQAYEKEKNRQVQIMGEIYSNSQSHHLDRRGDQRSPTRTGHISPPHPEQDARAFHARLCLHPSGRCRCRPSPSQPRHRYVRATPGAPLTPLVPTCMGRSGGCARKHDRHRGGIMPTQHRRARLGNRLSCHVRPPRPKQRRKVL